MKTSKEGLGTSTMTKNLKNMSTPQGFQPTEQRPLTEPELKDLRTRHENEKNLSEEEISRLFDSIFYYLNAEDRVHEHYQRVLEQKFGQVW